MEEGIPILIIFSLAIIGVPAILDQQVLATEWIIGTDGSQCIVFVGALQWDSSTKTCTFPDSFGPPDGDSITVDSGVTLILKGPSSVAGGTLHNLALLTTITP